MNAKVLTKQVYATNARCAAVKTSVDLRQYIESNQICVHSTQVSARHFAPPPCWSGCDFREYNSIKSHPQLYKLRVGQNHVGCQKHMSCGSVFPQTGTLPLPCTETTERNTGLNNWCEKFRPSHLIIKCCIAGVFCPAALLHSGWFQPRSCPTMVSMSKQLLADLSPPNHACSPLPEPNTCFMMSCI